MISYRMREFDRYTYDMRFSMDDSKDEAFKVARNFRKLGAWPSTTEAGMARYSSS
jgi:hypothetical protein